MSKKNAVAFVKPPEPAFLTAFKKQAGFKEGPSIDTKRAELEFDETQADKEDERPTVVVLKPGDLTEQEAEREKGDGADELGAVEEDDEPPADGKIRFKKPKKRSSDGAGEQEQKKKKTSSSKKVKNASLLSFTEEDEEDG